MMPQVLLKSRSNFTAPKRPTRATVICSLVVGTLFLCLLVHLHFSALIPTIRKQQQPIKSHTSDSYQIKPPRRFHFSHYLFDEGICHDIFHLRVMKVRLAELLGKHSRVAIVGVSCGRDVIFFAVAGYEVYAFVPMSKSMKCMLKWAKDVKADNRINAFRVAVIDVTGRNITAAYLTGRRKLSEVAKRARIEDYIKKPFDIQGYEWNVLRGAMRIVKEQEVRSMWVEILPCSKMVAPMLKELDDLGYTMFDMVPVGWPNDTMKRDSLFNAQGAARKGWFDRPSRYSMDVQIAERMEMDGDGCTRCPP